MKIILGMNSYRFGQMTKKGGIWEGQQIPTLWESKVAMGQEKGTIQNMMIDYITNVKKGKVEGVSHNRWKIIGLSFLHFTFQLTITAPLGLFFLPNRFRFSILLSLSKNQ